jgi:hypothetical protein
VNTLSLTLCLILAGQQATITWPLRTEVTKDVDGDGHPDKLVYEIRPWEKDYESYLKITSARGETLWEDGWPMAKDDLEELIETEGGVTGKKVDMKSWVKKFFSGELNYGAHYSREKLKATDLWDDPLDASAKFYGVTKANLKKNILSQKTNVLFSYRSSWREDLIQLVYVPAIRKFVCYQRGY